MIPLYICDDENNVLENLKTLINNIILIYDLDMEVVLVDKSPIKVVEHRKTHTKRSIYFLDVDFKSEVYNGFSLGKEIRSLDSRGFIIYVTTHNELLKETFRYRLEAMGYLTKDNPDEMEEQIRECLIEIDKMVTSEKYDTKNYYTIKSGDKNYQISIEEIVFLETSGPHRISLYTMKDMYEFRGDLVKIEKELKESFIRIHQSYLVNLNYIKEINYKDNIIVLKNNSECFLSKKGKKLLREVLLKEGNISVIIH